MENVTRVGIDLAKRVFHVTAVDAEGSVVERRRCRRAGLQTYLAQLPGGCVVAMESCGGAHHWARRALRHGLEPVLMSPQFVKPYVKSNKNDVADADAIAEASGRPSMRFVGVKSVSQEHIQQVHRARQLAVKGVTAQRNQLHGFLLEYGIASPKGTGALLRRLAEEVDAGDNELSAAAQRLMTIPGIGEVTATALVAAVGDASQFRNGRELAAWLGLVPRQHSTGGRPQLLGISKRGDRYLRALLIHGARSALQKVARYQDRRSCWAQSVKQRRGGNVAAVALANKNARTAWAVLRQEQNYDAEHLVAVADTGEAA